MAEIGARTQSGLSVKAPGCRLMRLAEAVFGRPARSGPTPASTEPVRIVIYGSHSPDWHAALGADAAVWCRIPQVVEVIALPHDTELPPDRSDVRTVVLPLMEPHILGCPRDRHHGLLPSDEAIRILGDKATFADFVARRGLSAHTPRHFASLARAETPCVIKRCDLNGGHGVAVAHSADELIRLRYSEPWRGHHVVTQAFEPSPHQYVTHAVCRDGRIVADVSYRQTLMDDPSVRRWSSHMACERIDTPEASRRVFEKFLRPLRYEGPCNFDYIVRTDGSICIFEINPRLGGSLMMPENADDLALVLRSTIAWSRPLTMA